MVMVTKEYARKRGWTFETLWLALDYAIQLEKTSMTQNFYLWELKHRIDATYLGYTGIYAGPGGYDKDGIEFWSEAAFAAYRKDKKAKLVVEHGSPRTEFAVLVFGLYKQGKLTEAKLRVLYDKLYKLAVITKEEDRRLNDATPEERWREVGIKLEGLSRSFRHDQHVVG
jgi:hypothetical protein